MYRECIEKLVARGAKCLPNANGNTALHWAVLNNHLNCVKYLLDNISDIDVMIKNNVGKSALGLNFFVSIIK